jgi:hypothetical protein
MPGFLGGSSAGSGTGGEIRFPAEFIDPVTKLRVSQPETLIDTDFEYGLQPTKWETVETINNTPSFFSKSGDTTIPNITAIITNAGTREITVTTGLEHGLSIGIPISVTGTKSVTADGTYIINSIPNVTTFTYLCKDNQDTTTSIEDLYTSIITGEFFQGSQIRISDAEGMTTDGEPISTITVTTPSPHGFKVNTPFYFLNLNSTISQEFQAANTQAKSFDASNSATAQTFDGSNTQSSINIDYSNSAVVGGTASTISGQSASLDTISVTHTTENFQGKPIGTPLYYNIVTGSGYFFDNPRGVVFLKTVSTLGTLSSTFQVSALPDGDPIDIVSSLSGTIQLANQARTFPGNNINITTEVAVPLVNDAVKTFDGTNTGDGVGTVTAGGISGQNITVSSASALQDLWYTGAMVFYSTDGSAATGLTNNTTYFINTFFQQGTSNLYTFDLKDLPTGAVKAGLSGGTGTQTFTKIGVSVDRDIFHIKNNGFVANDMLRYDYPVGGRFTVGSLDQEKDFYFVSSVYDAHNFTLNQVIGELTPLTQSRTGTQAGNAITATDMTAAGFGSGLTFTVASGTLPSGLSLNSSTGVVSGTPSAAYSTATVVIQATDSSGTTAQASIIFQFNPRPELYSFTTATFTPGGATASNGPNIAQARSGVGNPSWAPTYLNMSVNGIQLWTVAATGDYRITAAGARGGLSYGRTNVGGGASIAGTFALTEGEVLKIMVGQLGINSDNAGGGGGGTFVTRSNNAILVAAAGAGGSGGYQQQGSYQLGFAGEETQAATAPPGLGGGYYSGGSSGGSGGNGGSAPNAHRPGGGGGGYSGNGGQFTGANGGGGFGKLGNSFLNGGVGGVHEDGFQSGGFGGGGGGGLGGGGGGGYNGGGSGGWSTPPSAGNAGGGGGSLNNGSNQANVRNSNQGNGFVTITRL